LSKSGKIPTDVGRGQDHSQTSHKCRKNKFGYLIPRHSGVNAYCIGLHGQYISFELFKALRGHLDVPTEQFGATLDHDEIAVKTFEVGPNFCRVTSGAAASII
jgi:hypothetical protein